MRLNLETLAARASNPANANHACSAVRQAAATLEAAVTAYAVSMAYAARTGGSVDHQRHERAVMVAAPALTAALRRAE